MVGNYAVVFRAYNEGVGYRLETTLPQPQESRRDVGDVQADHGDRGDGRVGGGVPQVRQGQDERAGGGQPDRVGGRPGPLVHPVPEIRAGQRAVAGERVDHPRVRGDRGHPAEQLGPDGDEQQQLGPGIPDRGGPDLGRRHHVRNT